MARPATPIYASTLHRRDRAWRGARHRAAVRLRAMTVGGGAVVALAVLLSQHVA